MFSVCGNYQRKKGVFRESPQPSAHVLVGIAGTGGNRSLCLCLHFKSSLAHIAYWLCVQVMSLFICYKIAAWATFSVILQPGCLDYYDYIYYLYGYFSFLRLKHLQNIYYLYGYFSFLRLKHVQNICYLYGCFSFLLKLIYIKFTNCLVFGCLVYRTLWSLTCWHWTQLTSHPTDLPFILWNDMLPMLN